jgi:hypothetical protein
MTVGSVFMPTDWIYQWLRVCWDCPLKREIEKHGDCKSKKEFFANARRAAFTIQNHRQKITNLFKAKNIAYHSS